MSERNRERKPPADEQRGRRFIEAMTSRYNWPQLTGRQLEQVCNMADEFHGFMRRQRQKRVENP